MSRKVTPLTQALLKEHLSYDPATGEFRWLVSPALSVEAGSVAGHVTHPEGRNLRVIIGLLNGQYRAGRLAWLYMTGEWPTQVVDHRDGDFTNNRWKNLRDVDNHTNIENQTSAARSNKSSGLLGVTWCKRAEKWKAQIKVNQKNIYIGQFGDKHEAHQAYLEAKRRLHAGCTI